MRFFVPVEKREIDYPQEVMSFARNFQHACHVQAHTAQNLIRLKTSSHRKENEITRLCFHLCTQSIELICREELGTGTANATVFSIRNPRKTFGSEACRNFTELIDL